MDSAGAIEMFCVSVEKYNLYCLKHPDGSDIASFTKVVESKPYGDNLIPIKLECVGHYQKRTGTRLRQKQEI